MKVWQGCALAIGVFVLFIVALVGVVFWATGDIVDTADDFFAAAAEGDYDTAHGLTSQQLQNQSTSAELGQFLEANGLDKVTDTSWSSRSIENAQGRLEGSVTTEGGGTVKLVIELVKENDEWKISFIEPAKVGLQTSGSGEGMGGMAANGPPPKAAEPMVLPSAEDQEDLIFFTTAGFVNALADNDFSSFATRFDESVTLEELQTSFAPFVSREAQVRRTMMGGPNFEPATRLNDAGQLELEGSYGRSGRQLRFHYVFTGEGESQPKLVYANYDLD